MLALQNALCRRAAQPLVRPVHLGQQRDIPVGVPSRERVPAIGLGLYFAALAVLGDEPRDLRQAEARHLAQVTAHRAALLLAQPRVLLRHQHTLGKGVNLGAALAGKFHAFAQLQKSADLVGIQVLGILHV